MRSKGLRYISTRGAAPDLSFAEVLLTGLARDGGLYVPAAWPSLDAAAQRALRGKSYVDVAERVLLPFVGSDLSADELRGLLQQAYGAFGHRAVTPLVQLDSDSWMLELFHGPTLAFKDVAMQLLGRLFDHVLGKRGERVTIVGATSGDTGSAAIEACRDRSVIDIVILHPRGRTSEVQRRQMTSVLAPNVFNVAVEGTFDDCQDLVKAMFNDIAFRDEMRLSAVNSINWARIAAQTVYYVYAAVQLGAPDRAVAFSVPSGNFGNVYAGYVARAMGVPIELFIVGSNENDILARCFRDDDLSMAPVKPTLSPSMDIQVSSNFERLLFDLYDRSGPALSEAMQRFRTEGRLRLGDNRWRSLNDRFAGFSLDDPGTLAMIRTVREETGMLIDPHSAIGVAGARAVPHPPGVPVVSLATAHPAKFPDAVEQAVGVRPPLPPRLADLYDREERYTILPNDLAAVQRFVRDAAGRARQAA